MAVSVVRGLKVEAGREVDLPAELTVRAGSLGCVVFARPRAGPLSRHFCGEDPELAVARRLNRAGLATMTLDLLSGHEPAERRFDIPLLADRLVAATRVVREERATARLPIGYFGVGTGTAGALWAAAELGREIAAVVCSGGRPDLARLCLGSVAAPTLVVVPGRDANLAEMGRRAMARIPAESDVAVVPANGDPADVAVLAEGWFLRHLRARRRRPAEVTSPRRRAMLAA